MLGRTPGLLKIQAGYLKSFVEHLGTRLVGLHCKVVERSLCPVNFPCPALDLQLMGDYLSG